MASAAPGGSGSSSSNKKWKKSPQKGKGTKKGSKPTPLPKSSSSDDFEDDKNLLDVLLGELKTLANFAKRPYDNILKKIGKVTSTKVRKELKNLEDIIKTETGLQYPGYMSSVEKKKKNLKTPEEIAAALNEASQELAAAGELEQEVDSQQPSSSLALGSSQNIENIYPSIPITPVVISLIPPATASM